MTTRKRAPGGGRKRTGRIRHTVTLPAVLWQFVSVVEGKNRSERLEVALEFAAEKWGWEPPQKGENERHTPTD
jgi:hypothetical protein